MSAIQRKGRKVPWGAHPNLTLELLQLIDKTPRYKEAFFPKYTTEEKDRWILERDCCIELFKDDPFMLEQAQKKLVTRRNGKWIATKFWTSSEYNPISGRIQLLKQRMSGKWYVKKYSLIETWTGWGKTSDLMASKDPEIMEHHNKLRKKHPYYFLLKKLWSNTQHRAKLDIADDIPDDSDKDSDFEPELFPLHPQRPPNDIPSSSQDSVIFVAASVKNNNKRRRPPDPIKLESSASLLRKRPKREESPDIVYTGERKSNAASRIPTFVSR